MPEHPFLFEVDLQDEAGFDDLVMALGTIVLGHFGYEPKAATETLAALCAELVRGSAAGVRRCQIQFLTAGAEMQIVVCCAGDPEWRTSRALPVGDKKRQ